MGCIFTACYHGVYNMCAGVGFMAKIAKHRGPYLTVKTSQGMLPEKYNILLQLLGVYGNHHLCLYVMSVLHS